jgi:exodeoxyribonuclease VIII
MNAPINPFDLALQDQGIKPGLYLDLSNEEYHSGPGISKSGLDLIAENPSAFKWQKNAPVDQDKLTALDMGTALHCIMLEPEEFADRFIIAPEFNRRTTAGKADEKEFLANCADSGKTVMTAEEGKALDIMRDSAMAHPTVRWLFEQEGNNEVSIFWEDDETAELCRVRPDRMLKDQPVIVDVKKVADMDRFDRHVEEFRYHVQDAMYCEGYYKHFGVWPKFFFVAISSTISAGRYPVDVFDLTPEWKEIGAELFRKDLNTYHQCKQNNDWVHIHTIQRPRWAA